MTAVAVEGIASGHAKNGLKARLKGAVSRGFIVAFRNLRTEWRAMARHRAGVQAASRYAGLTGLRLHLGCGYHPKAGWVNVDLFNPKADVELDLREPWPFADRSARIVYSEHVFEHLDAPSEAYHYLAEALRILEPGGVLSIGVPDTEWPLRAYADPSDEYWRLCREVWHPSDCKTRMDSINYHFRQCGEHKWAWDEESLLLALRQAGFQDAKRREYDPALDLDSRRVGTLYVEARKP